MTVEMPTDEQAMMPMSFSLRSRRPINQLAAAPARGAKIIKLRRLSSCTILKFELGLCSLNFVLCTLFFVRGSNLESLTRTSQSTSTKHEVQRTKFKAPHHCP